MFTIDVRNVREAYAKGVTLIRDHGELSNSRAGPVLVVPSPVATVYHYPTERVLLDARRDQNPFFTLAESMWMLAGRDDAKFLDRFVVDFGARFRESDGRVHGAYGRRWRRSHGFDQVAEVIRKLRRDPTDRQCVLQTWDANPTKSDDLLGTWLDRPCNTTQFLRAHDDGTLDLTTCARSNDMIWGAYGANAVHFSFLLEYIASLAKLRVGKMIQFSNNFHVYTRIFEKVAPHGYNPQLDEYEGWPCPLVDDPEAFDAELWHMLSIVDEDVLNHVLPPVYTWKNKFLGNTVLPMLHAHAQHKLGRTDLAIEMVNIYVGAPDWRAAGAQWLERRVHTTSRPQEKEN